MSLTKAAEVLNKILYSNENSNGSSILAQSICSLPPILVPPENFKKNSRKLKDHFSDNLDVKFEDCGKNFGYEINERSLENFNGKSEINITRYAETTSPAVTDVSVKEIHLPRNAEDLNVVTVSRNSSAFPFFEQIFNVEGGSMTIGSLSDIDFDEFTPLDPSKYKTELCRSYQVHGYCKYGIRCNYAHGLTQIRVAYRHGKYKTRNCQSYHETGFCRYGARCSFIHDAEEGILKCPITDREVLEALHYRPMSEFHHIATITWRMVEHDSYPPTEVHFFTPSIGNKITEISDNISKSPYLSHDEKSLLEKGIYRTSEETCTDTAEEVQTTRSGKNFLYGYRGISNKTNKDHMTNYEASLCSETTFESLENPDTPINIYQPNVSLDENCLTLKGNELTIDKTPVARRKRNKEKDYNISRCGKSFSHPSGDKNSYEKSRPWEKNKNSVEKISNYSVAFKSFNLEDFLNCLKTREGQHHLASWTSETDRNSCSNSDSSSSQRTTSDFSCRRQTIRSGRDVSKYKTELCRSYQYNKYCEYNESCLYAHGTEDLRSYPKHPMYRSKKCLSFHKKGFCLYGSRCQFLHDIEIPLLQ